MVRPDASGQRSAEIIFGRERILSHGERNGSFMTRKEARKTVFGLLFESGFKSDEKALDIYNIAAEDRDIEDDLYVRQVYFGVLENLEKLDGVIREHSHGWKPERMSRVSRTVLRIAVYEMLFMEGIPAPVSINEALELVKEYDDDKARAFVNGVLNAVKDSLGGDKN